MNEKNERDRMGEKEQREYVYGRLILRVYVVPAKSMGLGIFYVVLYITFSTYNLEILVNRY